METRPVYTLNLAEKIEFMDLQEMGGGCGDWMELAQDRQVAGTCEYGDKHSGSKNAGNFLTRC